MDLSIFFICILLITLCNLINLIHLFLLQVKTAIENINIFCITFIFLNSIKSALGTS